MRINKLVTIEMITLVFHSPVEILFELWEIHLAGSVCLQTYLIGSPHQQLSGVTIKGDVIKRRAGNFARYDELEGLWQTPSSIWKNWTLAGAVAW